MYDKIAQYYDYIFPAGSKQLEFFKEAFQKHNVNKVLDLACGSGNYSIEFARWGLEVTGVDFEESMIEYANTKISESRDLNINFITGDMRSLPDLQQQYDAVVCIGNSLVHLLTDSDLSTALKEMHRLCRPGGVLIIQILNYDYILDRNVTILPDINNKDKGLIFTRQYRFHEDGLIEFMTSLILNKGHEQKSVGSGSVMLRPLRPKELESFLADSGFTDLEFYGGFDGKPASNGHMPLVAKATKM
ncbi:MAG: class I SAM-dependent methyltransferase [Firmicutes bacterium]|nr:class I SAM-dependent methyltransferase [Bacillota bacterium]